MPSGYGFEQHIVAVRFRLQGVGTFHSRIAALEDDPEQDLVDTTMSATENRPINKLANIRAMRMQVHGYIEGIDEYFIIRHISIYTKPISSGYPQ